MTGSAEIYRPKLRNFHSTSTEDGKEHQIPWMWNCLENVISTKACIWPSTFEHRLRETKYEGIYIDDAVMDYIKSLN